MYDETLYAGAAAYYVRGRMPYPAAVADVLREHLGPTRGRLLDVGCGPGSFTLVVAHLFDEVVAVDPDPDMLARAAERDGAGNVTWRRLTAEELPADLGSFDVVGFAQSFHWLDRERVAAVVRRMLRPGGVLLHVQATTHEGVPGDDPLPHPRPPRDRIQQLVVDYLGPERRAGRRIIAGTRDREDVVFRAAGFTGPHRLEAGGGDVVERSADEIVASVFSLSSSTPGLLGVRKVAFEADLRALLASVSPSGRFSERTRELALDIWRPTPEDRRAD